MDQTIKLPEDIHIETVELVGVDSLGRKHAITCDIALEDNKGYINYYNLQGQLTTNKDYLIDGLVTHYKCATCGSTYPKEESRYYTNKICRKCRDIEEKNKEIDKYNSLEIEENPEFPIVDYITNKYFFNYEDLIDQLIENTNFYTMSYLGIDEYLSNLHFVTAKPMEAPTIDLIELLDERDDYFNDNDDLSNLLGHTDDGENINNLNILVQESLSQMWKNGSKVYTPTNKRFDIKKLIKISDLKEVKE